MGCAASKVDPTQQLKLMRLAQSKGLFLSGEAACQAIRNNPGIPPEELIEQMEHSLQPRRAIPTPRDPRQMTTDQLRRAAADVADTSSGEHPPPVPLWHVEEVTPSMQPADIPAGLREGAEDEVCAICAMPLLGFKGEDAASSEAAQLPVRQLVCSHAFHTICVDAWLVEQAGVCPLCLTAYPRPASEERECRAKHAWANYRQRMANGGREQLEQHQREERERVEEAERRDRALAEEHNRFGVMPTV